MSAEALVVSRNQSVSNTVELLIRHANRHQLEVFMNAVSKDWELACSDRFMCHVTQTLIIQISPYLTKKASRGAVRSEGEGEDLKSIKDLFVDLWMYLMDTLALHMQDTYASHIVRVMLEVAGGAPVSEQVIRSRLSWKHAQGNDQFGSPQLTPISESFFRKDVGLAVPDLTDTKIHAIVTCFVFTFRLGEVW